MARKLVEAEHRVNDRGVVEAVGCTGEQKRDQNAAANLGPGERGFLYPNWGPSISMMSSSVADGWERDEVDG